MKTITEQRRRLKRVRRLVTRAMALADSVSNVAPDDIASDACKVWDLLSAVDKAMAEMERTL